MVSYGVVFFRSEMTDYRHIKQLPCHGKLYLRSEPHKLISEFGFPDEMYMEGQIWDDQAVEEYRNR